MGRVVPDGQVFIGRSLRRVGLSYGEIVALISVPRGTLAGWCRDIELTPEQRKAIAIRTRPLKGRPRDTQRKRHAEIKRIKANATARAKTLATDPLWTAGVALYWGEGSKTSNELALANSDPRAARLFVEWTRRHIAPDAEFVLKLSLHDANDEAEARRWWAQELDLTTPDFHKTYIKAAGTGHRKNHLPHGVCLVRMRRSTDAFRTAMAWIDALAGLTGAVGC